MTGDALKAKSGDEVLDEISRLCKGLFQGAKTVEDCVFALAMAITRQVIPSGGRVFMENRKIGNMTNLRECWCDWISGRQKGNFYKMMGSSSGEGVRSGRVGRDSTTGSRPVLTCFICGEAGHRAVGCKVRRTGSPNVDRVTSPANRVWQPTCFTCHKEGHKSPDCSLKKIGSAVKKEPMPGRLAPVNKASTRNKEKRNMVSGKVNGIERMILVDTGAEGLG